MGRVRAERANVRRLTIDQHMHQRDPAPRRWSPRHSTLPWALTSSLLLWASLPPWDLWPLAWIAPVCWLSLIRRERLPGRRPYGAIWVAGFAFWLGAVHWLRLPHWATSFGWLALSFYLAFYVPVFVGLSRVAVHGFKMPLIVAASVVWTGLELARAHLLTGFSMAQLGHTQFRWIEFIQVSDLAGAYAVSFVVMFVAACVARAMPCDKARWTAWPVLPAAAVMAATLVYGHYRLGGETRPGPKVALIQGSIDTEMKADPAEVPRVFREYFGLSVDALEANPDVDLIVWPETMYRNPWVLATADVAPPPGTDYTARQIENAAERSVRQIAADAKRLPVPTPLLLGIDILDHGRGTLRRFNSAIMVDRQGQIVGRYDKMHRVMFGEYVPFGESIPWVYNLTPLAAGIAAGPGPRSIDLGDARLAPNICFESVVPHLIRSQVAALRRQGDEPDILVNLTNDGWFWGSSELDMHLVCGVFRAVECRKPFLIAANTGFSAWIDADGRIQAQGPRRARGVIVADVRLDQRQSVYLTIGDWPAGLCFVACIGLAAVGLSRRRQPI